MRQILAVGLLVVMGSAWLARATAGQSEAARRMDVNLLARNEPLEADHGRLKVAVDGKLALESVSYDFDSQLAAGFTAPFPVDGASMHTFQLVVTGNPTACAYRLQGSNDKGVTWFNLSDNDVPCLISTVGFEKDRPVALIRGALITLSGLATVTMHYVGK